MADDSEYRHHGSCVVRTPLLPFDILENAFTSDYVRALLSDRIIREALLLASPSLDDAIEACLAEAPTRRTHNLERTIERYIARMASRTVPFGLFAGCAVAKINTSTSLSVGALNDARRKSRIDPQYLAQVASVLEATANFGNYVKFTTNTSITVANDSIRYWALANATLTSALPQYHQFEAPLTPALRTVLDLASKPIARHEAIDALTNTYLTVSASDAANFVDALIESQVLRSNLLPPLTSEDPFDDFIHAVSSSDITGNVTAQLTNIQQEIRSIDKLGFGVPCDMYRRLIASIEALGIACSTKRLLHVDLFRPASGLSVGEHVVAETRRGVHLLHRITPARGTLAMHRFRERFIQRYGDREVSLAEALDERRGIGFDVGATAGGEPSSLIGEISFPLPRPAEEIVHKNDRYKLQRLLSLISSTSYEWELTEADLEMLAVEDPAPLPDAILATISIGATSADKVDCGDFELLLSNVVGPSGVPLIARFCHGDSDLRALVERHISAEERCRPDAIFAEIVHLPDGVAGNLVSRPVLRSYELSYLGRSGASRESQIEIEDLLICVRDGRVRLRSIRLQREIIPRMSTPHNHGTSPLTTYRFLCTLQYEGVAHALHWDWGMLRDSPFLPRVRHGRIVLAPAVWTIAGSEVDELVRTRFTQAGRLLPRWVAIVDDSGKLLPVDLESHRVAEQLHSYARRRGLLRVQEVFPSPERMCARGVGGRFAHDILIPFTRTDSSPIRPLTQPYPPSRGRLFPPGSQWLYSRIYGGSKTSDEILRGVVLPLVRACRATVQIKNWFFVRYTDPAPHIRLRFEAESKQLTREILPQLQDAIGPLLDIGHVSRIEFATYERELERYGGLRAISIAERIFTADSDAAISIVAADRSFTGSARWKLALVGSHALLVDAGLNNTARLILLRRILDALTKAHRIDALVRRSLAARYRAERATVESLICNNNTDEGGSHTTNPIFELRSRITNPAFKDLRSLEGLGLLETAWDELLQNLLHMHINRVIPSDQLEHEVALYYFLHRAYANMAARL